MKTWLDEILEEVFSNEMESDNIPHAIDCKCEICKGKRRLDAFSTHKSFRERKKERSSSAKKKK